MNRLDIETGKPIVRCLVEGQRIRATVRMADVSENTVTKLPTDAGKACPAYRDEALRDLPCQRIQADEAAPRPGSRGPCENGNSN